MSEYCEICTMDRTLSVEEDFCCEARQIIYLESVNKRYRKALEDIIAIQPLDVFGPMSDRMRLKAREALEGDE